MCPHCGEAQLTVPLAKAQFMTFAIPHSDLLKMMIGLVTQVEAFRAGKLDVTQVDALPIECCRQAKLTH